MKNKEFEVLVKGLFGGAAEVVVKGPLATCRPASPILRGLYFEGSDFDKRAFYVWEFALPLYVPTEHLYFEFGERLRDATGAERWDADASGILLDLKEVAGNAIRRLQGIVTARDFVKMATLLREDRGPYTQQAIAYSFARLGDATRAAHELTVLLNALDTRVAWQSEMAERAIMLRELLAGEPNQVQRQLDAWEAESVKNLRIGYLG